MATAIAPLVVVMGVGGSGKTTVGRLLARKFKAEFLEGDDLHPPRNLERLEAGIGLTDNDRRDWFLAIAQQLADARAGRHGLVVACSALKRSHRDLLRAAASQLAFVHLTAEREVLAMRWQARTGQSHLAGQLQTLEAPQPDERAITLAATLPPDEIAARAAEWITQWKPEPTRKR